MCGSTLRRRRAAGHAADGTRGTSLCHHFAMATSTPVFAASSGPLEGDVARTSLKAPGPAPLCSRAPRAARDLRPQSLPCKISTALGPMDLGIFEDFEKALDC